MHVFENLINWDIFIINEMFLQTSQSRKIKQQRKLANTVFEITSFVINIIGEFIVMCRQVQVFNIQIFTYTIFTCFNRNLRVTLYMYVLFQTRFMSSINTQTTSNLKFLKERGKGMMKSGLRTFLKEIQTKTMFKGNISKSLTFTTN